MLIKHLTKINMGQGIIISMLMFFLLRLALAAAGDDMGRGKRRKNKNKFRQANNNQNNGGFAAVDNTAKKLDKKNKKNKHKESARVPAPFESIIIPEAKDMPQWPGD